MLLAVSGVFIAPLIRKALSFGAFTSPPGTTCVSSGRRADTLEERSE